jgi:hypothetical protein
MAPRWESVEAGIADGKALLEQGDVTGAVALWEQVGDAFPKSVVAFQGPWSFLVQARRFCGGQGGAEPGAGAISGKQTVDDQLVLDATSFT